MYRSDPAFGPEPRSSLGVSAAVLALPALVLLAAAARYESTIMAAGAMVVALTGLLILLGFRSATQPPASGSTILLYLIALGLFWFPTQDNPEIFVRIGRGVLLMGAVLLLYRHDLTRCGAEPRRRVHQLCRWLTRRSRWPEDLAEYHHLPEVRALREVISDDPSPVLAILSDPRAEVRAAALLALQNRPYWRVHESAQVLTAANQAREPILCATALAALTSAEDSVTLQEVATYLRHPSPEVRTAAFTVLLHNCGRRWPGVRNAIKEALADPAYAEDGPVPGAGKLTPLAVCDLNTWAAEGPPLADRAIQSIVEFYAVSLASGDVPQLSLQLAEQVIDPNVPPTLRVELANLLRSFRLITHDMLDRMSDVDQPGPVRLVAAEALLEADPSDLTAIEVLRGLGRQPNRETALSIAKILQVYLGMDMGLPTGEDVLPQSKIAYEAAKRVHTWATNRTAESGGATAPLPSGPLPRPQSSPTLSGLKGTNLRTHPPDRGPSGSLWSPK